MHTFQRPDKTVVAYKGGHYEKELLQRWGIPHFNLEQARCPKFDTMTRLCRPASSPPIRSQDHLRKIWSNLAHDVSLMSFLSIFCIFGKSISRRKIFNNQSEAAVFRRFSEDALHQSEARKSVTSTSENLV